MDYIPFPDKKYKIIYADPPWSYKVWSGKGKTAANHYTLMSIDDICNLNVSNISDTDCILFLWITPPCLPDAFKVINAWGFKYKTIGFTWVKQNKIKHSWFWGLGYWTRANAELCLIATKGHPKRISANISQIIDTPIEQHSKKPNIVRNKIIQLVGNLPRIELFARQKVEGWDSWGNETSENTKQNNIPDKKTGFFY